MKREKIVENEIRQKISLQLFLLNNIMYVTSNSEKKQDIFDTIDILFIRKISQEANIIKDILEGSINLQTGQRLRPKAPKSAAIIIRNVYETYIYWKFISNSEYKKFYSKAYFYLSASELRASTLIYDDFKGSNFFNKIDLNISEFGEVKSEFEKLRRKNPYPKWYQLKKGPKNFSAMNRELGMEEHFEKIYGFCSKTNHGLTLTNDIVKEKNKLYFDSLFNISESYKLYLLFLTHKLLRMINQDMVLYYKDLSEMDIVLDIITNIFQLFEIDEELMESMKGEFKDF